MFTETISIGNCRGAGMKPEMAGVKVDKGAKLSGDYVFDPVKADFGTLAKALTFNPQKVHILQSFWKTNNWVSSDQSSNSTTEAKLFSSRAL